MLSLFKGLSATGNPSDVSVELPESMTWDGAVDLLVETLLEGWKAFIGHLPLMVVAVIILLVTWLISSLLQKLIQKSLRNRSMRESLQLLILRLVSIAVWILGILLAAIVLFPGVTPSTLLGGMGVLSIAVGFAFRDIFENFFAGMLLLWRFPFENGDFIQCGDIEGKVERVEIRLTRIRLVTGELIVMPNSRLYKNPVRVMTDQPLRRITVMTGIAYSESLEKAISLIENTLQTLDTVSDEKPVEIFANGFGSSSMDIEVTWWTKPTPLDVRRSRSEVVRAVKKALDDAGIEIPFPYRTLTFKETLPISREGSDNQAD